MKKIFLDSYKEIMKKAFSIGVSISLMLTMLSLGQQNLVAKAVDSTSSEAVVTPNENIKTTIPIAMATDNNYTYVTLVSIISALKNAEKNTKLKFYIMVTEDFSEENKCKIQKVNDKFKNCDIEIINMENSFKEFYVGHWGPAMYYRLKLPSLLKNESKCIYLDGDTLVLKDLKNMYNLDISEYYVAGTPDFSRGQNKYCEKINVPDMNHYINSGVLLLNLAKMRENHVENKFFHILKNNLQNKRPLCFFFPDQDVLNSACYGKILDLPFKYGTLSLHLIYYDKEILKGVISEEDWLKEKEEPTIIHFAGQGKPWNKKSKFSRRWKKYERNLIDILNSKKT